MTLEQAKQLREPDLIEVNYRGNWLRHNFKKLENGKVLIGNLDLIKLEDCRLMVIKDSMFESFGLKKSDFPQFTYAHELLRYCKENNIEGKGWI